MQSLILSAAAGIAGFALAATKNGGGGGLLSANKSLVRKLYREVWNQKDKAKAKAAAVKYISDDHILIDPSDPNPAPGVDSYLQGVASLRDALTSIAIVVDDLVAQGLKVVAQLTFKASMGGKDARWTGTAIMEIEDGKVVKTWINSDIVSAMIQLGLMEDFLSGGSRGSFDRTVARNSGGGKSMHFGEKDIKVVQALLGRSEAHPDTVLTGNEWLAYFDKVSTEDEQSGEISNKMRVDATSGLDHVI